MEQSPDEDTETQRQRQTSMRSSGNGVPRDRTTADADVHGAPNGRTRIDDSGVALPAGISFDTRKCAADLRDAHSGVALEQ